MSTTVVLDLDASAVTVAGPGGTEVRPLPPGAPLPEALLDGLARPGHRFAVLLPDTPDDLRLQEAAERIVAPFGRPVHTGRLAAIAAAARAGGLSGRFLIVDLAPDALRAGLAHLTPNHLEIPHRTRLPSLGHLAFLHTLTTLCDPAGPGSPGSPGGPGGSTGDAGWDGMGAVAEALAVHAGRAEAAVRAAREDAELRDTPVFRVGGVVVEAGHLLDALLAYGARVGAELARLRPEGAAIVLASDAGPFPSPAALLGEGAPEPIVLGPGAVVEGAVHLAAGRYAEPPAPGGVGLPVHRVRDGLLEELVLPLPTAPGEFAALAGTPLLLGSGPGAVPLADPAEIVLDVGGTARAFDLSAVRPGAYRVGLRVSRTSGRALVLAAGDGSDPSFVPLEESLP